MRYASPTSYFYIIQFFRFVVKRILLRIVKKITIFGRYVRYEQLLRRRLHILTNFTLIASLDCLLQAHGATAVILSIQSEFFR